MTTSNNNLFPYINFLIKLNTEELSEMSIFCLAQKFKLTKPSLYKLFKAGTNPPMKPKQILNCIKLRKAAQLLVENPEMTVKELSSTMGYADSIYFIQIFKAWFGITPGKYRKFCTGESTDP